jgi:hypothetical protein
MRDTRLIAWFVALLALSNAGRALNGELATAAAAPSSPLEAVWPGSRYDVCPSCRITELTTVPWNSLTAGSVVNVFYRSEPYRTKIALRVSGTAAKPIIINGVTDASGNRPVISGDGAATAKSNANTGIYQDEHPEYGEGLALILIKRSQTTDPFGYKPKFIQLRNLELRGTYGKRFTAQNGQTKPYSNSAAGIWADVVEDLTIDNLIVTDHAFGIFINNRNAAGMVDAETSRRLTVRNSQIYGNGRVGSYLEHNLYLQGVGCTVEGNLIGTLRDGASGSSYKDRCSGSVIRNNRITCAARCLDLVHDESGSPKTRDTPTDTAPDYDTAIVTGNKINSSRSISCLHFGGDNLGEGVGPFPTYRNGPLTFDNNECTIHDLPSDYDWRAYVFDIQQVAAKINADGNTIRISVRPGSNQATWLRAYGTVNLGHNDAPNLSDATDAAQPGQYQVNH